MATCTCGHDPNMHIRQDGQCTEEGCNCSQLSLVCQSCSQEVKEIKWHMLGSFSDVPAEFEDRVKTHPITRQCYIELCQECGDRLGQELNSLYRRFFGSELAPAAFLRIDEAAKQPMALVATEDGGFISVRGGINIRPEDLVQVGVHGGKPVYDWNLG